MDTRLKWATDERVRTWLFWILLFAIATGVQLLVIGVYLVVFQ